MARGRCAVCVTPGIGWLRLNGRRVVENTGSIRRQKMRSHPMRTVRFAKPALREFADDVLNSAIQFWVDKSHRRICMTIQNLAVSDDLVQIAG